MESKLKNLCVINSVYSLMYYMILIDPTGNETLFVVGDGIPKVVSKKLKHKISFIRMPRLRIVKYFYLFIYYFIVSPLLKIIFSFMRLKPYGHDHVYFSNLLIGQYTVIEDGLSNYTTTEPPHSKLYQFLSGIDKLVGYSDRAEKIFLSGMAKIPDLLKHKSEIFKLDNSWFNLSEYEKLQILKVFSVDLVSVCPDYLLITQPISEDGFVTEVEKVEIYYKIILDKGIKSITIKKHPRDKTNYIFEKVSVSYIDQNFPIELMSLIGVTFKNAITLYSSAIFAIRAENKIIYGTETFCNGDNKLPLIFKEQILSIL